MSKTTSEKQGPVEDLEPIRAPGRQGALTSDEFEALQNQLLVEKSKTGQRAPGRARVDRIIEVTIELLKDHKPTDISIAMIADRGKITRTSVYSHFASVEEVLEQISMRFIQQTGLHVERYIRQRRPATLEQVVVLMIKGIQDYFNQPRPAKRDALAHHVPFETRHVIRDFDKVAALPYHTLWSIDWPIKPLSDDDPFRTLVIIQSALFETSIRRHGIITDSFVEQVTEIATDFVRRAEKKFGRRASSEDFGYRIAKAVNKLAAHSDPDFLGFATRQIELLADASSLLGSRNEGQESAPDLAQRPHDEGARKLTNRRKRSKNPSSAGSGGAQEKCERLQQG